ncbi:HAMP domain-containing histidine kinase [Mucilaginibacter sp. SMC90]|uniref:sensor histidine kinase n=1 Tax=Mucilaginibacter sp. SMC90 TaxID=2929803 RepID=UPI001FB2BC4E|nr:HAMP domain-containing sensor histidine kinase [Mucilaginibacter sp. SMC90]UOE50871.1 HAMP domain-containing histidine kinase [Mucilaginibacter sp. SMC90]
MNLNFHNGLINAGMLSADNINQPRLAHWEHDVISNGDKWSDAIFDILELPVDTEPDHNIIFNAHREPYLGMMKAAVAKAYESGTPWDLELELLTVNRHAIWVRSYGSAVIENNVLVKVKGYLMDIDAYRSDSASHTLLKQQHKQLSSFTHILTHNLRNYAYNISMLTELVERDQLDAYNSSILDKIVSVSGSLTETIEQMSEIIKAKEDVIESEMLNFDEETQRVLDALVAEIELHNASIETDFVVPDILFPKLYLKSILMNLISNSIKYRKENERPEILISTYFDDDKSCLILEYQDNGIGIDLERHGDKIFGLFKTFTSRPGSNGVGLFLVKTQVESQGGYIVVESKPDIGTIFRIFFKPGMNGSE